jgi:serine/threonine-protein kinase
MVVGFDPVAGTKLPRDSVVTVIVSLGHAPVAVPDVTGQTPEQAEANLEAAGFEVARGEDGRSAAVDAGEVMALSPGPADGAQPFGSTVTYTVSIGLPQVQVPDLKGMTEEEATAALAAVGLQVDATKFLGNKVRQQQPAAGETVDQGTTVKILVAS